jgi:hypothetical protein
MSTSGSKGQSPAPKTDKKDLPDAELDKVSGGKGQHQPPSPVGGPRTYLPTDPKGAQG